MGIKHYFQWFTKYHSDCMTIIRPSDNVPISIDTFGIDLNGIFHPAAQKVYQYGDKQPQTLFRLLNQQKKTKKHLKLEFYKDVCSRIETLVTKVRPQKRLLLCVDGIAGNSKMTQQRSRRFRTAKDNPELKSFDPNSITPGTLMMDQLTHYIEWFIYKKKQSDPLWKGLEVVYSNEKVPGEGEHKIKNLMRDYCTPSESFSIYGLDADLFMLCLSINRPYVYIIRDDPFRSDTRYVINIGTFAQKLKAELGTHTAVPDFILLCFMVGNDFLPQIKSLEILRGGIDTLLQIYKETCAPFGLVHPRTFDIRLQTLLKFLGRLANVEEDALKDKFRAKHRYHPDELMDDYFSVSQEQEHLNGTVVIECDLEGYKKAFYEQHFPAGHSVELICQEYLRGLQWTSHYYNIEIPNWTWLYPYHYAPFLSDLCRCTSFQSVSYPLTQPCDPFEQLLCVLPKTSAHLLPPVISNLQTNPTSPISHFYPDDFEVDLAGKKRDWEGIVLLPMIDFQFLHSVYLSVKPMLTAQDRKRNCVGKTFVYTAGAQGHALHHRHGTIQECTTKKNELVKTKGTYTIKHVSHPR